MPAAMVTRAARRAAGFSARATSRICCGLTASTMQSLFAAAASSAAWVCHLEFALEPLARGRGDLHHADRLARPALADQAADHGARHVAAADEGDLHVEERDSSLVTRVTYGSSLTALPIVRSRANGRRFTKTRNESPRHESLRSWSEDRGADAHHRRAFDDRRLEIVRHAHRQRVERVTAGGEPVLQLAQQREAPALERRRRASAPVSPSARAASAAAAARSPRRASPPRPARRRSCSPRRSR